MKTELKTNHIYQGNALDVLKTLPNESIDCVMTSPPYWGLRDYGTATWEGGKKDCDHQIGRNTRGNFTHFNKASAGDEAVKNGQACPKCGAVRKDLQLGLEPDFRDYIENLCLIFDEVKRVLKPTGTCWVNLGDTYSSQTIGSGGTGKSTLGPNGNLQNAQKIQKFKPRKVRVTVPEKSLVQIPSRFAIAMTDRGWILRNEIIWYKKNVMPSSVKDRFTVDFEKIFFFTKSKKYYFEQQFEPVESPPHAPGNKKKVIYGVGEKERQQSSGRQPDKVWGDERGRNRRAVWQINPQPFSEAHFAVFPPKLVETPIKAGCPERICRVCGQIATKRFEFVKPPTRKVTTATPGGQTPQGSLSKERFDEPIKTTHVGWDSCKCKAGFDGGVVLDPFFGSGTTGLVAEKLNRKWVGIELNPEYIEIANRRLGQQGLGI